MMARIIILCLALVVCSCSGKKVVDIKSPCVSNEDGPCGPRKPINDWWIKKEKEV